MKGNINSIILSCFILSWSSMLLAADQQAILSIPKLGRIKITAHSAVPDRAAGPFLTFETGDGKLLKRIDFELGGPEGYPSILRFKILHQESAPGPLIVAVESTPAVSAVIFEAVILGFINGEVKELTTTHIQGQSLNCLYVGNFGKNNSLGFVYFDFLQADDEAHYDPHQYEAKLYEWKPNKFVQISSRKAKLKYQHCDNAAVELGYHFKGELFKELNTYSNCK